MSANSIGPTHRTSPIQEFWNGFAYITGAVLPQLVKSISTIAQFVDLLRAQCDLSPEQFRAIPGGSNALEFLEMAGWDIALATGGWHSSALLKLAAIGVTASRYPLASASDHPARSLIVALAIDRAENARGENYTRVVSIGDGVWDVATAKELKLPFIGVASGDRANRLRTAGASIVLRDYVDLEAFQRALDDAAVPI